MATLNLASLVSLFECICLNTKRAGVSARLCRPSRKTTVNSGLTLSRPQKLKCAIDGQEEGASHADDKRGEREKTEKAPHMQTAHGSSDSQPVVRAQWHVRCGRRTTRHSHIRGTAKQSIQVLRKQIPFPRLRSNGDGSCASSAFLGSTRQEKRGEHQPSRALPQVQRVQRKKSSGGSQHMRRLAHLLEFSQPQVQDVRRYFPHVKTQPPRPAIKHIYLGRRPQTSAATGATRVGSAA